MLFYIVAAVTWIAAVQCGGGYRCKEIKQAYPEYKISRKPLFSAKTNGTCNVERTCCKGDVEVRVKEDAVQKIRQVVSDEVNRVQGTLKQITDMTAMQMKTLIDELVPKEVASMIDTAEIGDLIWQYTMGNITSYELTVEVAVIGSDILFTEKASQKLRDMAECIIRELASVATDAFHQISLIVEGLLEAPRTFGKGFYVVNMFLEAVEQAEIPYSCDFGQLFGCPRCGVKVPDPCYSSCKDSANNCLENVLNMRPLWTLWVESISVLTDAMVLMKDIQMNPDELVTPEMIQKLTDSITMSMFDADFAKCRKKKKRSIRSVEIKSEEILLHTKRGISEGELLKTLLSGHFSNLIRSSCRGTVNDDRKCWLGNKVGDYSTSDKPVHELSRETKSYKNTQLATIAINEYKDLVDDVISKIYTKVRASRDSPPSDYRMFSGAPSRGDIRHTTQILSALLCISLTIDSIMYGMISFRS